MALCSLTLDGAELIFRSPYSPALVSALKTQIPATDRRWDGTAKAWRVLPRYGQTCATLAAQYCHDTVKVPDTAAVTVQLETRLFDVRYVGMTKDRGAGAGERTAFALTDGKWDLVLPESVLRGWFAAELRPNQAITLYSILGVQQTATEAEMKSAYRRLARSWHPDVCKEVDAAEQFKAINHAYSILSDGTTRHRYDAGLALSRTTGASEREVNDGKGYRSPLRCGLLMVEGHPSIGRFVAMRILAWEDVTNTTGEVLVTSWPVGATEPEERWV